MMSIQPKTGLKFASTRPGFTGTLPQNVSSQCPILGLRLLGSSHSSATSLTILQGAYILSPEEKAWLCTLWIGRFLHKTSHLAGFLSSANSAVTAIPSSDHSKSIALMLSLAAILL